MRGRYNELTTLFPNDSRIKRYYDEFTNSFIYNSNAIEGNPITEQDTYVILSSDTFLENYSQKSNQEVVSLYKGFKYTLIKPAININTLLKIHKYVLYFDPDNAGIFRSSPVHIGEKNLTPFEYIPNHTNKLFSDLTLNDENVFEFAAEFHLKFENIHPFIDGNGRTGRLLLNLMLIQQNYLPINLKYVDRGKYYRAFRQFDINREKGVKELYSLITKCEYDELTKFISMFE